jgi:hypothetical protein
MCNKPWLLCVDVQSDGFNESPIITFHEGEGPAEEAGMKALEAQPNAVRFSVYRVVSEFARVTEIKRVSLKPTMGEG